MRIVIITQSVNEVVTHLSNSRHNVVGIIESAPRTSKKNKSKILYLSRYLRSRKKSLWKFAKSNRIPYYYFEKGDNFLEDWIRNLEPEIVVIRSMSQLLEEKIFRIPSFGTINLHGSLLPRYRGPNPTFWTYYHMDLRPGITVHYVDKGEDTGDIIYQAEFDIDIGTTLQEYSKRQMELGVELVLRALDDIEEGIAPRQIQPESSPTPRARNIFEEEHRLLIDWHNWPIERIWHILRGTSTWLDALEPPSGLCRGQRWTILEFEKCLTHGYQPGNIYYKKKRTFVACTDGKIYLSVNFNLKQLVKRLAFR